MERAEIYSARYASPLGELFLSSDGQRLTGLWIEGQKYFGHGLPGEPVSREDLPVFGQVRTWLDRYFAGELPDAGELPLAPAGGAYRQAVWDLLRKIPLGQVVTYGQLAQQLPGTSGRAVGGAVGHNPISILIPCHRVVGAGGRLTGYAGGIWRKRWLLEHEGVDVSRLR